MREKLRVMMLANADVLSRLLSVTWIMTFAILLITVDGDGSPEIALFLIRILLVGIIITSLINLLKVTFWTSLLSGLLISLAFLVDMTFKVLAGRVLEALPLLTIIVSIPIASFVAFTMDEDMRSKDHPDY